MAETSRKRAIQDEVEWFQEEIRIHLTVSFKRIARESRRSYLPVNGMLGMLAVSLWLLPGVPPWLKIGVTGYSVLLALFSIVVLWQHYYQQQQLSNHFSTWKEQLIAQLIAKTSSYAVTNGSDKYFFLMDTQKSKRMRVLKSSLVSLTRDESANSLYLMEFDTKKGQRPFVVRGVAIIILPRDFLEKNIPRVNQRRKAL